MERYDQNARIKLSKKKLESFDDLVEKIKTHTRNARIAIYNAVNKWNVAQQKIDS